MATFEDPTIEAPASLRTPIATISAATNHHLIRRRHANANPALPLQHDTRTLVDRILNTVCDTATASRTLAQHEENRIYCWFEGWLPDHEELPTTQWEHAWIDSDLLRNTFPATTPAHRPSLASTLVPSFDPTHPDVLDRIRTARPPAR